MATTSENANDHQGKGADDNGLLVSMIIKVLDPLYSMYNASEGGKAAGRIAKGERSVRDRMVVCRSSVVLALFIVLLLLVIALVIYLGSSLYRFVTSRHGAEAREDGEENSEDESDGVDGSV